jgi:signal peptidase I
MTRFVVDCRYYQQHDLSHGDLVVFSSPIQPEISLVKRVIGLPGDTVVGRDGQIIVNGNELQEPYVAREGAPKSALDNFGPFTVPPGKFFVLGDNRNNSFDSRSKKFGFGDVNAILGKPLYTIPGFSHSEIRSLK